MRSAASLLARRALRQQRSASLGSLRVWYNGSTVSARTGRQLQVLRHSWVAQHRLLHSNATGVAADKQQQGAAAAAPDAATAAAAAKVTKDETATATAAAAAAAAETSTTTRTAAASDAQGGEGAGSGGGDGGGSGDKAGGGFTDLLLDNAGKIMLAIAALVGGYFYWKSQGTKARKAVVDSIEQETAVSPDEINQLRAANKITYNTHTHSLSPSLSHICYVVVIVLQEGQV